MSINKKRLKEFQDEMRKLLSDVSFAAGQAVVNDKLISYLSRNANPSKEELRRLLYEIFPPEFERYAAGVFKKYNGIVELVNTVYRDFDIEVTRDFSRIKKLEHLTSARLGDYSERAQKEIVKRVRRGVVDKLNIKELSSELKSIGGKVEKYADTISTTQLKGYARLCKSEQANIAEVFYFEYVGQERDTIRDFCAEHLGNIYHIEEINKMDAGKAGIKPVITYCGGWNCIHDWEPDPFYKAS